MTHTGVAWLRRPWVWALVAVALLAGGVASLRLAPVFQVETVAVAGNEQVTDDEVLSAAGVVPSSALLTLPVEEIVGRVESLDAVASARVVRDWPDTVRIEVRERRPVGYVDVAGSVLLVGSDGSLYRRQPSPPTGLPLLPGVSGSLGDSYLDVAGPDGEAAFTVSSSLPPSLQRAVEQVSASGEREVQVLFSDGVVVDWGSTIESERKAQVVALLHGRAGWSRAFLAVDVSVPDAPALRDTPAG